MRKNDFNKLSELLSGMDISGYYRLVASVLIRKAEEEDKRKAERAKNIQVLKKLDRSPDAAFEYRDMNRGT